MKQSSFNLEIFGLSPTERTAVSSVCNLTRHRRMRYEVVLEPARTKVDIALVDGDDSIAQQRWAASPSFRAGRPHLLITSSPDFSASNDFRYTLNRSRFAARLIRTLDEIVAKQVKLYPGMKVDDQGAIPNFATSKGHVSNPNASLALVVDDSATVRMQMRALLELVGIRVKLVGSAEEGLKMAEQHCFDIVFMDIELPEMDGYTACRRLKSRDKRDDCPVVMLTARDGAFDRIRGMIAGCNRYLTKPVAAEDLYLVLHELLPQAVRQSA